MNMKEIWVKDLTDPPKDIFKAFFATKKITENKYLIVEIIILENNWLPDIQVGDVIEDWDFSMLNYRIYRDDEEISSNGFENLYIIKKENFKCFYDYSVDDLIQNLYNKLKNYDKLIGVSPYSEIYKVLEKYNNS
jgi:hypothetical protein